MMMPIASAMAAISSSRICWRDAKASAFVVHWDLRSVRYLGKYCIT